MTWGDFSLENLKERHHVGNLDGNVWIIIRMDFKKVLRVKKCTGHIWLSIQPRCGLL
jgi:hypothetical protein